MNSHQSPGKNLHRLVVGLSLLVVATAVWKLQHVTTIQSVAALSGLALVVYRARKRPIPRSSLLFAVLLALGTSVLNLGFIDHRGVHNVLSMALLILLALLILGELIPVFRSVRTYR